MTDRISTLKQLQQRIRDSKGADRELDCEIANLHGWRCDDNYNYTPSGAMTLEEPPHYTTDPEGLGACVALERALDAVGSTERVVRKTDDGHSVFLNRGWMMQTYMGCHAIETHAHLLAIISAYISELEAKQTEKTA